MSRPSILDLITARRVAAQCDADRLREQIAALAGQLATVETELAELATTRTTLLRLTGDPDPGTDPDTTITSPAYQQILAVFDTTDRMRAKDVCVALGAGTAPKDTEGARAKLKRLVARGLLTEAEPGLFALARPTANPAHAPVA